MGALTPCPDMEMLQRYAAGQTSPQESLQLTIHFVKCPISVQTVDDLKRVATQLLGQAPQPKRSYAITEGAAPGISSPTETSPYVGSEPIPSSPERTAFFSSVTKVEGAE